MLLVLLLAAVEFELLFEDFLPNRRIMFAMFSSVVDCFYILPVSVCSPASFFHVFGSWQGLICFGRKKQQLRLFSGVAPSVCMIRAPRFNRLQSFSPPRPCSFVPSLALAKSTCCTREQQVSPEKNRPKECCSCGASAAPISPLLEAKRDCDVHYWQSESRSFVYFSPSPRGWAGCLKKKCREYRA